MCVFMSGVKTIERILYHLIKVVDVMSFASYSITIGDITKTQLCQLSRWQNDINKNASPHGYIYNSLKGETCSKPLLVSPSNNSSPIAN
jgi:hypothetical protein